MTEAEAVFRATAKEIRLRSLLLLLLATLHAQTPELGPRHVHTPRALDRRARPSPPPRQLSADEKANVDLFQRTINTAGLEYDNVTAFGDVRSPSSGEVIAGCRLSARSKELAGADRVLLFGADLPDVRRSAAQVYHEEPSRPGVVVIG